jgi:hypothetical protein
VAVLRAPGKRSSTVRVPACARPTLRHAAHIEILVCAPRVPVARGTHGEPWTTTVRIPLIVRQKTCLLTVGCGPDLCKAVLGSLIELHSTKKRPRRAGRSPGWSVTRAAAAGSGWDAVGHLVDLPPRLPHGTPGTELDHTCAVPSRAAPGVPCGRAAPDRRDAPPVSVCKIVGNANGRVRSPTGADRLRSC